MSECPTCGQETGLTAALVDKQVDWDELDYKDLGSEVYNSDLSKYVELVDRFMGTTDSYGYVDDSEAYLVVRIGDRNFRKAGTASSYSGVFWDGECREVKGKRKVVYEYV